MKTAAYVLGIIGTIAVGWCLIPLIWCIPMLVGGILLLFDKD